MRKFQIQVDFIGSPDGYTVIQYHAGQTATLSDDLAAVALAEQWATEPATEPAAQAALPLADQPPPTAPRRRRKAKEPA